MPQRQRLKTNLHLVKQRDEHCVALLVHDSLTFVCPFLTWSGTCDTFLKNVLFGNYANDSCTEMKRKRRRDALARLSEIPFRPFRSHCLCRIKCKAHSASDWATLRFTRHYSNGIPRKFPYKIIRIDVRPRGALRSQLFWVCCPTYIFCLWRDRARRMQVDVR